MHLEPCALLQVSVLMTGVWRPTRYRAQVPHAICKAYMA